MYQTWSTSCLVFRSLIHKVINKVVQYFLYVVCLAKCTMWCFIICKLSQFYYNFITIGLGKSVNFQLPRYFCPQMGIIFGQNQMCFYLKMNLCSQEISGLFLLQTVTTLRENTRIKKKGALPNHTKGQKFLKLNNFVFNFYILYISSSQILYKFVW